MNILSIPSFVDNYMYVVVDEVTKECAAIDPGEPKRLLYQIAARGWTLTHVFITHHHLDHSGGNNFLKNNASTSNVPIYCGEKCEYVTNMLKDGQEIVVGNLTFVALLTPAHTQGSMCYLVRPSESDEQQIPVLFTGDTLFVGGCGKFLEGFGTAQQMNHSLNVIIAGLQPETRIFPGHEFTLNNIKFASLVEPNNHDVARKLMFAKSHLLQGSKDPFYPVSNAATIADEMRYNPFMRVKEEVVLRHCGTDDPIKALQVLRAQKDFFNKEGFIPSGEELRDNLVDTGTIIAKPYSMMARVKSDRKHTAFN